MQKKMPPIFQDSPGFETPDFGGCEEGLKYSSVPGNNWAGGPKTLPGCYVAVVQKAGEKSGFISGIMCSFLSE